MPDQQRYWALRLPLAAADSIDQVRGQTPRMTWLRLLIARELYGGPLLPSVQAREVEAAVREAVEQAG